jgi:hypothetical protein
MLGMCVGGKEGGQREAGLQCCVREAWHARYLVRQRRWGKGLRSLCWTRIFTGVCARVGGGEGVTLREKSLAREVCLMRRRRWGKGLQSLPLLHEVFYRCVCVCG